MRRGARLSLLPQRGHPNDLTMLFDWENNGGGKTHMNSEELHKKMKQAGLVGVPEIQYLAEMYSIHRSAAD